MRREVFGRRARVSYSSAPAAVVSSDRLRERCEAEFFHYLKAAESVREEDDPLLWWRVNCAKFPTLSVLARKWLRCVATSVPSERAFSTGGNVVTAKRCSLAPAFVRDAVYIAENSTHTK